MSTEKKNKKQKKNIAIQTVAAASTLISFCVPLIEWIPLNFWKFALKKMD